MSGRLKLVTTGGSGRSKETPDAGFAERLLTTVRTWRMPPREERRKQLRVVETLTLGAENKLVLVSCAGERFLVAMGAQNIGTLARVRGEASGLAVVRELAEGDAARNL